LALLGDYKRVILLHVLFYDSGDWWHVIVLSGYNLTLNLVLLTDMLLAKETSPGLVVRCWRLFERIVFIINLKDFIPDPNGSDSLHLTMSIYVFECIKVEFLVF